MTQEAVPESVETMDNLRIAIVPDGELDPKSVADLGDSTVKDLTYSLTPDGWAFPRTETEITDRRLTLAQEGSRPGREKIGPIVLRYVYGSDSDVARAALAKGTEGTLVYRDAVPNATAWTLGQKVDLIKFKAGAQRKLPPAADGTFQIEQTIYVKAGGLTEGATLVA